MTCLNYYYFFNFFFFIPFNFCTVFLLVYFYSFFQAGAFMGCAITSAVFGGIIIICFSISIAQHHYYDRWYGFNYWYNYDAEMAVTAVTLILGIVEFGIGIWAAVLCCYITSCDCCATSSEQVCVSLFLVSQIFYFWILLVHVCTMLCYKVYIKFASQHSEL